MNRRPGRVMDTATQNAGEPGGVYLNGLVNDSRPWNVYAQFAITEMDGTTQLLDR
ncbi:MAG: hypothetical protein OSB70_17960 [Myxococcota bacterium]|nr:hypothetical protein [Myxococcota bacterium]